MDRNRLIFRYFFNAGLDKVTGICDGEGSDVFEVDDNGSEHYIGSIYYQYPAELSFMEDDELEEIFASHGIFPTV